MKSHISLAIETRYGCYARRVFEKELRGSALPRYFRRRANRTPKTPVIEEVSPDGLCRFRDEFLEYVSETARKLGQEITII
jgi:hypothetical protein